MTKTKTWKKNDEDKNVEYLATRLTIDRNRCKSKIGFKTFHKSDRILFLDNGFVILNVVLCCCDNQINYMKPIGVLTWNYFHVVISMLNIMFCNSVLVLNCIVNNKSSHIDTGNINSANNYIDCSTRRPLDIHLIN